MSPGFERLLAPLRLRGRTMPSRVVFAAHQTNFATKNRLTPRHAAYYAARAAGGAGMVVLEGSVVHPSDWPYEYAIFGHERDVVPGYRLCAEAVHAYGALAVAQLTHSGQQGSSHYSQSALWAPSPVPETNSREVPKEMEEADIAAVVAGFAQAAAYAVEAGLDGVELNAGQESLIRQFLSPLTNQRQDGYGGELEHRLRFAREVIAAVRERIGPGPLLGLRLCADEYAPWAGIKPDDAPAIARLLAAGGQLDFVSVTSGSIYTLHMTRAGLYAPPGYSAHLAGPIRAATGLPTFAQGSIVDPAAAEGLLADGTADAAEMTRALIADPDLVRKLRAGRPAEIRPCLLLNQDFSVRTVQNPRLSCENNPAAGYELEPEFAPLTPAPARRRVLVVGGGPAGLEAARVAALRGHEVTLHEREGRLGGALRLAAAAPGRERIALEVEWLERQVRALGVLVETGSSVTPERVRGLAPDAVIVATGARPQPYPRLRVDPEARVAAAREVLAGAVDGPPGHAVVLDEIGNQWMVGAAEWLADRGWQVTVVTPDMFVGQQLTQTNELSPWNQRAPAKGVAFMPMYEPGLVAGRAVHLLERHSREELTLDEVDLVVCVNHEAPDEALYLALKGAGHRAIRAGDCVAPRRLSQAILEGHRAGRAV
ncbi:MAG TPA: FAD-dependent oxidoreductase [Chloroflexaceae bacterium]|nr:FAD-dependent oxidoreductase [Chloroflexaceae bacterium]